MSDQVPTTKEASPSIMSSQQSISSTTALLPQGNSAKPTDTKPAQGLKGFLNKLQEEDKERKARQVQHISYDEAKKRTGYDCNGFPDEEKRKEKEGEGKGDKRLGASLFFVA